MAKKRHYGNPNPEGPMTRKGMMDRETGYRQPEDSNYVGYKAIPDDIDAPEHGMYGDFTHMGGRGVHAYPARPDAYHDQERGNRYEEMHHKITDKMVSGMARNKGGGGSTNQGQGTY